jgi:predicted MFS family arabinose efflux permease
VNVSPDSGARAARRGVLLAVLAGCSFVMPLSLFLLSPLLVNLTHEFNITVAQAGLLVTFTALPSALLALAMGPLSDFLGRRPLLVGGASVLAVSSFASALAPTYELMAVSRVASGIGVAALGPSIFASVGDLFPYAERGRAYGWTIGANTLSSILGIPLATILAALVDWRWSFGAVGVATGTAAVVLAILYRPSALVGSYAAGMDSANPPSGSRWSALLQTYRDGYLAVVRTPTALAIFGSTFAQAVGLMAFETYLGALLITRYDIGTGELAPIFGVAGLGTLIGSQIGGRMGDRFGHKPFMSWSVLAASPFVLLLGYAHVSLVVAGLLNFIRNVPMGMRFTSASAIISEAVPGARATMNSVNQSCFNLGVMGGSVLGGIVVEQAGYSHVSLMTVAGSIVSALLITFLVVEHRPTDEELQEEEAASASFLPRPT